MTNFEKWRYYCKDLESPQSFIDWSYYWTISSVLQRRVWIGDDGFQIFPNIFVCFVARPGIGKSLAARIGGNHILKNFYKEDKSRTDQNGKPMLIPQISFSADCTSPESLIQQLSESIRIYNGTKVLANGSTVKFPIPHNSMSLLLSEEMTTLFRANMQDIPTFLNQWWDAQNFDYKTKHNGSDIIKNICVCLLGCTTPENMKKLMLTGVLDQGFTARAIFIFDEKQRSKKLLYKFTPDQLQAFKEVREHIKKLNDVEGPLEFSPEAFEYFQEYYESGKLQNEICNNDYKLEHYRGRIKVHVIKLAALMHYSEEVESKVIQIHNVKNAITMLRSVEPNMHRALASGSKNIVYDVANEIVEFLKVAGPQRKLAMFIRHTSQLNKDQWEEAIDFLKTTKQIKEEMGTGDFKNTIMLTYSADCPQLIVKEKVA